MTRAVAKTGYLEKSVEQYLRKEVEKHGGRCIKQDSETGIPDRLVLTADGRHCFVEVKRPGGTLSAIQKEYHKRLQNKGHLVFVLWNFEDVDGFIKDYFKKDCFEKGKKEF